MNELNENDWALVNAYHDGELSDVERQAMESRLRFEPALQEALRDIASVSASLGALRPETGPSPSEQVAVAANQNRWPTRWLVGGAVAAAVGDRLARLGASTQTLVITHSPQVAARANQHLRIAKTATDSGVISATRALSDDERAEEIARMLAGETVTAEARAAAAALLEG